MLRLIPIALLALLLTGCSKINMENYNKLETGMSYDEVVEIIGSPTSCSEKLGTRSCIWGDKDGANIKANFMGDNAVLFSNDKLK